MVYMYRGREECGGGGVTERERERERDIDKEATRNGHAIACTCKHVHAQQTCPHTHALSALVVYFQMRLGMCQCSSKICLYSNAG